jgi:tetratricopeptide (TPR) repeat protein
MHALFDMYRAHQAYKKEDYHGAQARYEDSVVSHPSNAQAHYNAGVMAFQNGEHQQALDYFSDMQQRADALSLSAEQSEQVAYNAGNACMKLADYRKAITQYDAVLAGNPDHEKARELLEKLREE